MWIDNLVIFLVIANFISLKKTKEKQLLIYRNSSFACQKRPMGLTLCSELFTSPRAFVTIQVLMYIVLMCLLSRHYKQDGRVVIIVDLFYIFLFHCESNRSRLFLGCLLSDPKFQSPSNSHISLIIRVVHVPGGPKFNQMGWQARPLKNLQSL